MAGLVSSITDAISDQWDTFAQSTYSIALSGTKKIYLEFDTIDEVSVRGSATVTKYPVETGYYVTDYKFAENNVVTMTGIISRAGSAGVLGASFDISFSSIFSGQWPTIKNKKQMIADVREKLIKLKDIISLVDVKTKSGLWKRMTLTDFEIKESLENFSLFEVEMTFEQVRLIASAGVAPANPIDSNTVNQGKQQVVAADPTTNQTIILKTYESGGAYSPVPGSVSSVIPGLQ